MFKVSSFIKSVASFVRNKSANVFVSFTLISPAVLGTAGLSMDYYLFINQKSQLQAAADSAALASVKELKIALSSPENALEIAKQYAEVHFGTSGRSGELATKSEALPTNDGIKITLSYYWEPIFAQYFGSDVTPITVTAIAKLAGDGLTCVIGLMEPQAMAKSSIHLDNNSYLKADRCSVYSNSHHRFSIRADDSSKLHAESICSAGGVLERGSAEFEPAPIFDCPKIQDPLIDRAYPPSSGCNERDLIVSENRTLRPGVYCGGLTIAANAVVDLEPGIFVIKDGPLKVLDNSTLKGEGAGFFLKGLGSTFEFAENTTIDLSAPETGMMAGLLFFEDRESPFSFKFNPFKLNSIPADVRVHKISSNNARNLLGTVYLPNSILLINANAPVADASAYTAIIVGRLWLQEGPVLTLNADYTDTEVPVPGGLINQTTRLVQ